MLDYQTHINLGIKRLRKQHDLTQDQFAEKIDMNVESVRNLEQNKHTPTAKTINTICSAFNIRPIDLLFDSPSQDKTQLIELILDKLKSYNTDELRAINETLDSLSKIFVINSKH